MTAVRPWCSTTAMDTPHPDWIVIAVYENRGRLHPMAAARA
ncbi:hypothetical protein [Streptomyces sp. NPDC046887]